METKHNIKNCINCQGFVWWDGDYACMPHMSILCESKNGDFNEDILKTMKTSDECSDYKRSILNVYQKEFDEFMKKKNNNKNGI